MIPFFYSNVMSFHYGENRKIERIYCMEKKTETFQMRLTAAEKLELKTQAERFGMSITQYVKFLVFNFKK